MVYWQISGSIDLPNDTANDSRNTTNATATTVFSLLPIVAIVVIGSIMIGIIAGFGGASKPGK